MLMGVPRPIAAGAVVAAIVGAAAMFIVPKLLGPSDAEQWTMVQTYCLDCHSRAEASGGLVLVQP